MMKINGPGRMRGRHFCIALLGSGFLASALPSAANPETVAAPKNTRVSVPTDASWAIQLPKAEAVQFRGHLNQDKAGMASGAILYPGAGLAGLLVAIAAHGAIQSSALSAQQRLMQAEADKVLVPFQPVLDAFSQRELFAGALARWDDGRQRQLIGHEEAVPSAWRVRVDPTFTMTQDQSALLLHAAIAVSAPPSATTLVYTNVISVVLRPLAGDNRREQWSADDGKALKTAAARMLAEALRVSLSDMTHPTQIEDSAFRTLRYREGNALRVERAAVLSQACGRWVIRNLRGWIKSVPANPTGETKADCADPLQAESSVAAVTTSAPPPTAASTGTASAASSTVNSGSAPADLPAATPNAAVSAGSTPAQLTDAVPKSQ